MTAAQAIALLKTVPPECELVVSGGGKSGDVKPARFARAWPQAKNGDALEVAMGQLFDGPMILIVEAEDNPNE